MTADNPLLALVLIGSATQLIENPLPRPITRPAAMPVINGLPVPVSTRQVPPRSTTAGSPEHPIDHHAVIGPPATPTRNPIGQQRLQTSPLIIGQIMRSSITRIYRTGPPRFTGHALVDSPSSRPTRRSRVELVAADSGTPFHSSVVVMPSKGCDRRKGSRPTHALRRRRPHRMAWHGVKRPASTGRLGPDNTEVTSIAARYRATSAAGLPGRSLDILVSTPRGRAWHCCPWGCRAPEQMHLH